MKHQKLRQAIINANPHKTWIDEYDGHINIIRLENVLIAWNIIFMREVGKKGIMIDDDTIKLLQIWDLTLDLDNQKTETKDFLNKILVK